MKQKEVILLLVVLLPAVGGWFIKGYGGGFISGVFTTFFIASVFGMLKDRRKMMRINRNIYNQNVADRRS